MVKLSEMFLELSENYGLSPMQVMQGAIAREYERIVGVVPYTPPDEDTMRGTRWREDFANLQKLYVELLAAAYSEVTGVLPQDAVICTQMNGFQFEVWIERKNAR